MAHQERSRALTPLSIARGYSYGDHLRTSQVSVEAIPRLMLSAGAEPVIEVVEFRQTTY